ncbi:MAG: Rrf2 family transcriptional regulator [Lentimicrobiaceae bacterium]|nr:Rrf2 family transcriptional regulator [Lentimicrobiaceae bacterium]
MFSKACEYAIRATLFIARQSIDGHRAILSDISVGIESPLSFTSKILQQLVKAGIISSAKGKSGGFYLTSSQMREGMVSDIVALIDGDKLYTQCGLGLKECSSVQPCPAHERLAGIRNELKQVLETTSIHSLAVGIGEYGTFLKR